MYTINILSNNDWCFLGDYKDEYCLEIALKRIQEEFPTRTLQILKDDIFLSYIMGNENKEVIDYQYFYFINKYLRNNKNFDYIEEYHKTKGLK